MLKLLYLIRAKNQLFLFFTPSREVFTPSREVFTPSREVFTPSREVFTPM